MEVTFKVDSTPLFLGLPGAMTLDSTSVLLNHIENTVKMSDTEFKYDPNMIFQTFNITFRAIQSIDHWQFVSILLGNLHAHIVKELSKK